MAAIARIMQPTLGELEQRLLERRETSTSAVITNHAAFTSEERLVFKAFERRRSVRRGKDVRRRLAGLK